MAKSSRMDAKFLSKLEKYNSSMQGEASFRVLYYGGAAGSVPFVWESQPGTPKHKFSDHPLPPLTPPPQYQSSPRASPLQKKNSKNSRILNSIFARVPSKKENASPLFSPPSPFSSAYSLPSTPVHTRKSNSKGRSRSAVHFGFDEDEFDPGSDSPTSTLCFGPRNGSPYRKFKSVKKVVKSIVGYGNSK
ncbi:hypothetical protein ACS0TY_001115 [Phlomoides rotata]